MNKYIHFQSQTDRVSRFLEHQNVEDLRVEEERLIVSFLLQKTHNTQRAYKTEIASFLKFLEEKKIWTLKSCRTSHCVEFLSIRSHLKPSSIKRSRDALSSLMTFLMKTGFLSQNPFSVLDSMNIEDLRSCRTLSKLIIQRLFDLDVSFRDQSLVRFLYVTGLRRAEVCKVKFIHFRKERRLVFLTVFGKGRKVRTLALDQNFYKKFIEPLQYSSRGEELNADTFVYRPQNRDDRPLSVDRIYEIVKSMMLQVGAPPEASPHWLRHSHGSHSIENGVHLRVLQTTLGHSSLATTQVYLEANPQESSSLYLL